MKITAYFAGCNNFGDKLTEYLLGNEKTKIIGADIRYCKIIGIGSILERLLIPKGKKNKFLRPIIVFGSGYDNANVLKNNKMFQRELKCYAVRGEKTKKFIQEFGGEIDENVLLADGGLLVARMLDASTIQKKYELGIIPHYVDYEDERFEKMKKNITNSIILDVRERPEDFLKHLAECKRVISTAMHPCIAADALRVPNLWAYLPNANQVDMSFKFNDYYSAYGKEKQPYIINGEENETLLEQIESCYDIEAEIVEQKIRELENIRSKIWDECEKAKLEMEITYLIKKCSKLKDNVIQKLRKMVDK